MMIPLNKTHEGCVVLVAQGTSRLQYYIEAVDEESKTVKFRYTGWAQCVSTKEGFSNKEYLEEYSNWKVVKLVSRYNKPINILTELKIAFVECIHRVMANIGFGMNQHH